MNKINTGRSWTQEEIDHLYNLVKDKTEWSAIGKILGRTANACQCKYKEYNWTKYAGGSVQDDLSVSKSVPTAWSEDEVNYLFLERSKGTPYIVISRQLGKSYDSVRHKYQNTDWTGKTIDKIKKREIESFKVKTERGIQDKLDKFRLRSDIIADAVIKSTAVLPTASLNKWEPKNRKNTYSPEDIGLILSDLHIGQEHTLAETGGISQYNLSIFKQRMENLKNAVADIYELHSQLYKISKLHIFSLGDVVAGMNNVGAWSPVYINMPIYDQVQMGVTSLMESIWFWLTIFDEIEFYGIRGNHGRTSYSGAEKDYCNWDIIIYQQLLYAFKDNPRIKFHIPKTWWHMAEIRNHKFLMFHGDDVSAKNPPITALLDTERKMAGLIKSHNHYTLAGHFHNASEMTSTNGKVFINGAFVGSDIYSLKNCLPGTRPEQKIFGIHDNRGVTFRYDIDLDYERSK